MTLRNKQNRYWFFRSAMISSIILLCFGLLIAGFSMIYVRMQKIGFNDTVTVLSFTDGTVNIYGFTADLLPLKNGFLSVFAWINDTISQIVGFFNGLF